MHNCRHHARTYVLCSASWLLVDRSSVMSDTACLRIVVHRSAREWQSDDGGQHLPSSASCGVRLSFLAPQTGRARLVVRRRRGGLAPFDALRSPRVEKGMGRPWRLRVANGARCGPDLRRARPAMCADREPSAPKACAQTCRIIRAA
jgi:hypothetical protein